MIQSLSGELGKKSETRPLPHSLVGKVNKVNRQSGYKMMGVNTWCCTDKEEEEEHGPRHESEKAHLSW